MCYESSQQILKLCRTLRPTSAVRRQAESVLSDPHSPIEDLPQILRSLANLSAWRKHENTIAQWLIWHAEWTEDQRDTISDFLSRMVDRAATARKPGRFALRWLGRSMLLSLAALIVIYLLLAETISLIGVLDHL